MRKRMITLFGLTFLLLVLGQQSLALASGPSQRYTNMAYDITDMNHPTPMAGSHALLVTTDNGASLPVQTSGLTPGHTVTVWWVIFNYPENCSGGVCGADDAFPPPGNVVAGASVSYPAGHVIGGNGRANFGAHISAGGAPSRGDSVCCIRARSSTTLCCGITGRPFPASLTNRSARPAAAVTTSPPSAANSPVWTFRRACSRISDQRHESRWEGLVFGQPLPREIRRLPADGHEPRTCQVRPYDGTRPSLTSP